jgi:hypothetical protein
MPQKKLRFNRATSTAINIHAFILILKWSLKPYTQIRMHTNTLHTHIYNCVLLGPSLFADSCQSHFVCGEKWGSSASRQGEKRRSSAGRPRRLRKKRLPSPKLCRETKPSLTMGEGPRMESQRLLREVSSRQGSERRTTTTARDWYRFLALCRFFVSSSLSLSNRSPLKFQFMKETQ